MSISRHHEAPLLLCMLVAVCVSHGQPCGEEALSIVRPAANEAISTHSLAIHARADSSCAFDSVAFFATYIDAGFNEDDTVFRQFRMRKIGVDSTRPYRYIWDISNIQDHYHYRMWIDVVGYLPEGDSVRARTGDFVIDRHAGRKRDIAARAQRRTTAPSMPMALDSSRWSRFLSSNNTVWFRPVWTRDSLCVMVRVRDDSVLTTDADNQRFWQADQIELYLDVFYAGSPLERQGVFQFVISPDGRAYGGAVSLRNIKQSVPISASSRQTSRGYVLRIAIAWRDLGPSPEPGDTLGFDIANFDRDSDEDLVTVSTWAGNHLGNHHNASEWGSLALDAEKSNLLAWLVVAAGAVLVIAGIARARRRTAKRDREESADAPVVAPESAPLDRDRVSSLTASSLKIVDRDFANESCGLDWVARKLNRTSKHISAVFRKDTGVRFTDYLNDVRLCAADRLLRTTSKTAFDVSIDVGYHSYEYFSRQYKKKFGQPPSAVRNGRKPMSQTPESR